MKRTLAFIIVSVALSLCTFTLGAQTYGLGVIGGFTSSSATVENFDAEAISVYHFGLTDKFNLGLGFAIQPSILYQVKGAGLKEVKSSGLNALDTKVGYLEVPVQFQWGPDLLAFRPYVFAEPFVGCGLNFTAESPLENVKNNWENVNIKRWEYGLGLGAGIEIWHLQISGRYFWNFGSLCADGKSISTSEISNTVSSAFSEGRSFNGFSISVAFFLGRNDR